MLITKEGQGQGGQGRTGEDDALIAKRPLFWSCLSCEKGLDNFQGKLGDYRGWGVFPPKETTPERMGRVFFLILIKVWQRVQNNVRKNKIKRRKDENGLIIVRATHH